MTPEVLRIGHISGPHGLHGMLRVAVLTDIPGRFSEGSKVLVEEKGILNEYDVSSFALHKPKIALIRFEGIESIEDSERISGCDIFIPKSLAEQTRDSLDDGEFYFFDLIGADVYYKGSKFGSVIDIVEGGSGHILQIEDSMSKKHFVPFIDSMVDTAKLADKRIDITPVDGLIEE
jgi:16S rRNA processing protein RimM